jgi:DinB family protein
MQRRIRELLDYLDGQRAALRAAFDAVPPNLRDRPPAPGRWSTAGVVEHLALAETRAAGRIADRVATARAEGCAAEQSTDPVLPTLNLTYILDRTRRANAPEPLHPTGLDAVAAWAALEHAGAAVRQAVQSGDDLALAAITIVHPFLGEMSVCQYIANVGTHEARHAGQIHEINSQLPIHDSQAAEISSQG